MGESQSCLQLMRISYVHLNFVFVLSHFDVPEYVKHSECLC